MGKIQKRTENSRDRFREVKPFLDSISLKANSRVLDVGTGSGWASQYFFERGMEVTALDYDFSTFEYTTPEIQKIASDFRDISKVGLFDVVIMSHVLEHFSNPGLILEKVRNLLRSGGILIIIVPKYTPYVTDGHWNSGWNIGQLGNFLANAGFDCRSAIFRKTGLSVCGYGIKRDVNYLDDESSLSITIDSLPIKFADFQVEESVYLADFKFLSANLAIPEFEANNMDLADISIGLELTKFLSLGSDWWEIYLTKEISFLNEDEFLKLIVNVKGEFPLKARLIVGFETEGSMNDDPYVSHADMWFTIHPGLNVLKFSYLDFELRVGNFNWGRLTSLSLGGPRAYGEISAEISKI